MKKTLLILVSCLGIIACNTTPEGYTLTGTLSGEVADGTNVILKKVGENDQPFNVDTVQVQQGTFVFTGQIDLPEMHYVFVDKLLGYTSFVLENGDIALSAHKDSLGYAEIGGSKENDILTDFREESKVASERAASIQEDLRNAAASSDTVLINSLREELEELGAEYESLEMKYIKDHSDALISPILINRSNATKGASAEELQALYDGLSPRIKQTTEAKRISKYLEMKKQREKNAKNTDIGAKAPNFSGPTPSGENLALNDVLGKATLIDFWAAWCRPCRAENPNIVKVYNKYHDKGLNIIGVSLDRTAEAWTKAIEDDGLAWNHISNIAYFDDAIARLYNVNAIPAAFLLDENGIIVAKNLRGPALEAKVSELLD